MDFKKILVNYLTSFVIVIKKFFALIFSPYKTMRKISLEKDYGQLIIIAGLIFLYFKFIYYLRDKTYPATLIFLFFLFNFLLTVSFFYLVSRFFNSNLTSFSLLTSTILQSSNKQTFKPFNILSLFNKHFTSPFS